MISVKKGIRFRLYPTKAQQAFFRQTFGCCRLIYNRGLAMRQEAFHNGEKIGYKQTSAMLTALKKTEDFAFLKDVDAIALQQALRDLDRAFVNFFQKRANYPRFKSKHHHFQSYRTINQGDNIRIIGRAIKLPKIGLVKIRQSMPIGHINNVTIEQVPSGKFFAVLNVDFEPQPRPNNGGEIGLDMGLSSFYTDSFGQTIDNPKYLENTLRKLAREQRRLSRKQKGSKNWQKQRIKVALIHEKIANQRNDFLHKQSTRLVCENQTICIEDLKVKNMLRNRKLAKAIQSVSWGKFVEMLTYKAFWYGTAVIKVPTFYASSQLCSVCGYKNPDVKNLNIRAWDCLQCGSHHDRDTNAALNILHEGLRLQPA